MLDRPDWDDAFYRIKVSHKERLALKESVMLKGEILPLEERMKRFAKKAGEVPRAMYCPEKQDLDKKMIRPGKLSFSLLSVQLASPFHGQHWYRV